MAGRNKLSRRRVLELMGTATAASFAGCSGGGDDGDNGGNQPINDKYVKPSDELGERVPELSMAYWTGGSSTPMFERLMPIAQKNLSDGLKHDIKIKPIDLSTLFENAYNDQRTFHMQGYQFGDTADRLDPNARAMTYRGDWAGSDGNPNIPNYASCEYTDAIVQQQFITDTDKRRERATDAITKWSKDVVAAPIMSRSLIGITNDNVINVADNYTGNAGAQPTNHVFFIKSTPVNGDQYSVAVPPIVTETLNHMVQSHNIALAMPNNLTHSPLVEYDHNYEKKNLLADSVQAVDDTTIRISLENGLEFHDGTQITADDVVFTLEHLERGNFPKTPGLVRTLESIEKVDNLTTELNLKQPYAAWKHDLALWGVLHSEHWKDAGAVKSPGSVQFDSMPGSGPFQVRDFQQGSYIDLTPAENHPKYNPDHSLLIKGAADPSTSFQELKQDELAYMSSVTTSMRNQARDNEDMSVYISQGLHLFSIMFQHPMAPGKFRAFRMAIGKMLDRKAINDVTLSGSANLHQHASIYSNQHPFRPPDEDLTRVTDSNRPKIEEAREVLFNAGWGWDEDGNLRYPKDADLSPQWPKGEEASSEHGFKCIDSDGKWLSPE